MIILQLIRCFKCGEPNRRRLCNTNQLCSNIHHVEEQICYTIALQNNFSTAGLRQLEVKGNLGDYCAELMRILPMCLSIAAFLLQLSRSPANNGFKSGGGFFVQIMNHNHRKKEQKQCKISKKKYIIHNCVEEWQFCCKQVIL